MILYFVRSTKAPTSNATHCVHVVGAPVFRTWTSGRNSPPPTSVDDGGRVEALQTVTPLTVGVGVAAAAEGIVRPAGCHLTAAKLVMLQVVSGSGSAVDEVPEIIK